MQNLPRRDSYIMPDQLCVGLYVHLDLNWTKHPFSFSSFKIEKTDQIDTIRGLGLQRIRYTPNKSDCYPVEVANDPNVTAPVAAKNAADPVIYAEAVIEAPDGTIFKEKHQLIDRMAQQGEKILACEREFAAALRALKLMWQNMFANPAAVAEQAGSMVGKMAESTLMESEIAIHLMIDHKNGSDIYTHALNVAVLSMILAKEMGRSLEDIKLIGLGALFHDVGCTDAPRRIKEKSEPLTTMEAATMHQHCKQGVDICNRLQLPYEAVLIVWQHHERIDGSGYPAKLRDKQLSPLASIVAVADAYDEICNPINSAQARTPHESLSLIYAQQRTRFDGKALTALVHCLGVYPPGTIVLLSNGIIGMVVAVNTKRPLKPTVLVYDPATAKNEAILIDLEQEVDVSITKTISPHQLSPEIFEFLAPGKRASYYMRAVA